MKSVIMIRRKSVAGTCRVWIAVAIVLGGFFHFSSAKAQTVDEYLLIERGEMPNVQPEFNLPLMLGVLEGLAAFSDAAQINGTRFFCVPKDQKQLKFEDFKKRVDQLLYRFERERDDFETYAKQTSIGIIGLKVLIEAYPCFQSN